MPDHGGDAGDAVRGRPRLPLRQPGLRGRSRLLRPYAARHPGDPLRLAAYTSVEVPLRHGFATRAGLRVDRFQGLATTLAPFGVKLCRFLGGARISASRSHQALASLRNEETLLASQLAYDLLVPVGEAPVPRNTEFSVGWHVRRRASGPARRLHTHVGHLRLPPVEPNPIRATVLGDPSLRETAGGEARGMGGLVELDVGPGDFDSGELPLGRCDPYRGCADLHAPVPPRP